jgi:hypothetical protein
VIAINFQKYEEFYSDDFVNDHYFTEWIQQPDNSNLSYFWETFIKQYPEKEFEMSIARHQIINSHNLLSHLEQNELWHQINLTISNS